MGKKASVVHTEEINMDDEDFNFQEESPESAKRIIEAEDGTLLNFGKRTRVISREDVTDTGFTLVFYLANGTILSQEFNYGTGIPQELLTMAAFGVVSKVKNGLSACKTVEDCYVFIESKLQQILDGNFSSKKVGDTTTTLNYLQKAYALKEGVDPEDFSTAMRIKTEFAEFDKEKIKALKADKRIRFLISELRHEEARVALEAEETLN